MLLLDVFTQFNACETSSDIKAFMITVEMRLMY